MAGVAADRRPGPRGRRARASASGGLRTFFRVTLHQIRPALVGGLLLVALILLAEFGTFEILRFQTVHDRRSTPSSSSASAPTDRLRALARRSSLLGLVLLVGEALGPRAWRRGAARPRRRGRALAHAARPCDDAGRSLGLAAPARRSRSACRSTRSPTGSTRAPRRRCRRSRSLDAALSTARYSAAAAALATVAAVPVALLAERHRSKGERRDRALDLHRPGAPGIVVALSFVYFTIRYALPALPVEPRADRRLRDHVLPARARRRSRRRRAGAARARGGRPLARARTGVGALPRHAADPRAGARGRLLARLHQRLDRADGDADPPPDRREHARDRASGPTRTTSPTAPPRRTRSRCSSSRPLPGLLLGRWFERIAGAEQ